MEKRLLMVLTCLFLVVGGVIAQTTISGTVVSQDDGLPIIGAAVRVSGTNEGTVTDADGRFTILCPEGKKVLTISYVGMESVEVVAKPNIRIVLRSGETNLNEVVVTALGIKRSEKALGYSATTVKSDDITRVRTSDVVSSMSGTIAGVQVNTTSGDPGASQGIVVRGFSSLSGNNQPLFVIDGVPMDNTSVKSDDELNAGYDFGNGASAVNPDDVESMTVLKGAAATALYGSRAANGVVMITTKTGQKHAKGVGIEYNGGIQWSVVGRLPEMQNSWGQGWDGHKTEDENGSWGPAFDGSVLPYGRIYDNSQKIKSYRAIKNNLRDFFETGVRYNNSVSFNNANEHSNYFVSLSQIREDGIIPTDADTYDKYTFSFRGGHQVGNLSFKADVNYSSQANKFAETGQGLSVINDLMQTPRDISIVEMKDLNDIFNTPGYYYTPYGVTNPYYILDTFMAKYKADRLFGKFQMDYDFLKYFKATYRIGLDVTSSEQRYGKPNMDALFAGTYNGDDGNFTSERGKVEETSVRRREINQDFIVNYNQDFANDFNVNALAGLGYTERKYHRLRSSVTDLTIPTWYNLSNSAATPTTSTYDWRRRSIGAYAEVDVAWRNMVYLTIMGRNDWSSTLPKDNRSFFYPGVTGSWVFSELLSDEAKTWFDFGKLRLSWGQTGNDADVYMVDPYYISASFNATGWGKVVFPINGVNAFTKGNALGSNTLQPEITTEFEAGFNVAFFKNRINIDFCYYNRNSDKQIFELYSDPATGYTAQNMNLGKVRNQGIEALLTVKPVVTKDFEWSTAFNFTKNWSKVISLPESLGGQSSLEGLSGGPQLYAITGMALGQFMAEVPMRDPEGHIVVNAETGLPIAKPTAEVVGSMNNKYTLGINTTLRYKDFTLGFVFDIRQGGLMYSRTKSINYFVGNAIQTGYNERYNFIVPNSVNAITDAEGNVVSYVENTTPIAQEDIDDYFNAGGEQMGSAFLIDKSFVKLRNVSLSWDLPKRWIANTFLTGVRLSVFGSNLLCWTPSDNTFIDPEATSFGNDLKGSYGEYSSNPSSRKFGFNVQVKF